MLDPLKRVTRRSNRLREVAYHAIKDAILDGRLSQEDPLVEERLAVMLQISRTPVREALAILEHEGLIEAVPYKGMFVRDVTLDEFLLMYETMEIIEPTLARLAAARVQDSDIAQLDHFLGLAERCTPNDVAGHLAACRQFQLHMGRCAGNPHLTSMLLSIEEHCDLYLLHVNVETPLSPERMEGAIRDRRRIFEALEARDSEGVVRAAEAHARAVRSRWHDLYPPSFSPRDGLGAGEGEDTRL